MINGLRNKPFPKIFPIMPVLSQKYKFSFFKLLSPKSEPQGRVLLKISGLKAAQQLFYKIN